MSALNEVKELISSFQRQANGLEGSWGVEGRRALRNVAQVLEARVLPHLVEPAPCASGYTRELSEVLWGPSDLSVRCATPVTRTRPAYLGGGTYEGPCNMRLPCSIHGAKK